LKELIVTVDQSEIELSKARDDEVKAQIDPDIKQQALGRAVAEYVWRERLVKQSEDNVRKQAGIYDKTQQDYEAERKKLELKRVGGMPFRLAARRGTKSIVSSSSAFWNILGVDLIVCLL